MTPSPAEPTAGQRSHRSLRASIARIKVTPLSFSVAFATLVVLTLVVIDISHLGSAISGHAITWWLVLLAAAAGYGQYLGYTVSLRGASERALPFGRTFQLEVAESVTTMITPESMGNIALTVPFLTRQGLEPPEAVAAAGLSAFGTTLVGIVLLPICAALSVSSLNTDSLKKDVPSSQWEIIGGILLVALLATLLIKIPKLRHITRAWLTQGDSYLRVVAGHPARGVLIGAGELITIGSDVAVLSLLLLAVDQPLHLAAFVVIVLLAQSASSIVPVPGGLGAPEAILVAGLSSVGVAHSDTLLVALGYRMLTYWLPPIPGALCFYDLDRRALV